MADDGTRPFETMLFEPGPERLEGASRSADRKSFTRRGLPGRKEFGPDKITTWVRCENTGGLAGRLGSVSGRYL